MKPKIHFSAAVDGNQEVYRRIIQIISKDYDLVTDYYVRTSISELYSNNTHRDQEYLINIRDWIMHADVVIFDVTKSDVSIGFEIAFALNLGKQVIILVDKLAETFPFSLRAIQSMSLQIITYDLKKLESLLIQAITYSSETDKSRFNFALPTDLNAFLRLRSKKLGCSKADLIRMLIEKEKNSVDNPYTSSTH